MADMPGEEPAPALPRRCRHDWPSGGPGVRLADGAAEECRLGCGTSRERNSMGVAYHYPEHPLTADTPRPLTAAERARWKEIRGE